MTEIKITPEMIEAGLIHLYRYHPDSGVDDETTVTLIYRAMEARRRTEEFVAKALPLFERSPTYEALLVEARPWFSFRDPEDA